MNCELILDVGFAINRGLLVLEFGLILNQFIDLNKVSNWSSGRSGRHLMPVRMTFQNSLLIFQCCDEMVAIDVPSLVF